MSISKDSSRNRSGLPTLRGRYRRRAVYLLENPKSGFLDAVEKARAAWSERYPQWSIRLRPIPADLAVSMELGQMMMFWPQTLWRDYQAAASPNWSERVRNPLAIIGTSREWCDLVHELAYQYWPEHLFVNPFAERRMHGAAGIVSASLLHCSDTTIIPVGQVDHLLPRFAATPKALPYSPYSHLSPDLIAVDQGKLFFYERLVDELLKDSPERRQSVHLDAIEAGWEHSRNLYPHGSMPPDTGEWWWYVPILPGMSAEDVRRVESEIEEVARHIAGETPIDDMIFDLLRQGATHQGIADSLGIDKSTVTRRIRSRRKDA